MLGRRSHSAAVTKCPGSSPLIGLRCIWRYMLVTLAQLISCLYSMVLGYGYIWNWEEERCITRNEDNGRSDGKDVDELATSRHHRLGVVLVVEVRGVVMTTSKTLTLNAPGPERVVCHEVALFFATAHFQEIKDLFAFLISASTWKDQDAVMLKLPLLLVHPKDPWFLLRLRLSPRVLFKRSCTYWIVLRMKDTLMG